eukprot:4975568-Amphidinium_carterae.1
MTRVVQVSSNCVRLLAPPSLACAFLPASLAGLWGCPAQLPRRSSSSDLLAFIGHALPLAKAQSEGHRDDLQ